MTEDCQCCSIEKVLKGGDSELFREAGQGLDVSTEKQKCINKVLNLPWNKEW